MELIAYIFSLLPILALVCLALLVYFLPSIIASDRKHPNANLIFLVNLFLGATGVAWLIILIWACSGGATPTPQEEQGGCFMTLFKAILGIIVLLLVVLFLVAFIDGLIESSSTDYSANRGQKKKSPFISLFQQ